MAKKQTLEKTLLAEVRVEITEKQKEKFKARAKELMREISRLRSDAEAQVKRLQEKQKELMELTIAKANENEECSVLWMGGTIPKWNYKGPLHFNAKCNTAQGDY